MIIYKCEGCGACVHNFGRDTVPISGFCAECEWLSREFGHDPEEMMAIRKLTNPDSYPARRVR